MKYTDRDSKIGFWLARKYPGFVNLKSPNIRSFVAVKIPIFIFAFLLPFLLSAKGFSIKKIQSTHPYDPRFDYFQEFDSSILDQKFIYLNSGNHCYAFLSDDGKYVLKFFKQKHMNTFSWRNFLPLYESNNTFKKNLQNTHQELREKTYKSCCIANQFLPKETGMIYLHLTKTGDLGNLTLVDQKGKENQVNLSNAEFYIQRRADVGFSYLDRLFQSGEKRKASRAIQSLLSLVEKRCELGIFDRDMQVFKNFGFINNEAIEVDIGEFHYADDEILPSKIEEINHVKDQITRWIKENHS